MAEIINLYIGNTGVNIGKSYWSKIIKKKNLDINKGICYFYHRIMQEKSSGEFTPRALFIDTEGFSLGELERNCFESSCDNLKICLNEDTGGLYSYASQLFYREYIFKVEELIRRQVEACSKLDGFFVNFGSGGGTGSGFSDMLHDFIRTEHPKTEVGSVFAYPCKEMGSSHIGDYNSLLSIAKVCSSEIVLPFDNSSLYKICVNKLGIPDPCFNDLNEIITKTLVNFTSPLILSDLRFSEYCSLLKSQQGNNIITSSCITETPQDNIRDFGSIFNLLFDTSNALIEGFESRLTIKKGVSVFTGRLNEKESVDISNLSLESKACEKIQNLFYDSKDEMTLGLYSISNQVIELIQKINRKFDLCYYKRAFVYRLCEAGFEEGQLTECREVLEAVLSKFRLEFTEN